MKQLFPKQNMHFLNITLMTMSLRNVKIKEPTEPDIIHSYGQLKLSSKCETPCTEWTWGD